jgi:hypothetical protein
VLARKRCTLFPPCLPVAKPPAHPHFPPFALRFLLCPCLPAAGPLEGCYFTLAAVRGSEEEQRARQLVQQNGGRMFTDTTLQRITGGWVRCSVVWQQCVVAAEAGRGDFAEWLPCKRQQQQLLL